MMRVAALASRVRMSSNRLFKRVSMPTVSAPASRVAGRLLRRRFDRWALLFAFSMHLLVLLLAVFTSSKTKPADTPAKETLLVLHGPKAAVKSLPKLMPQVKPAKRPDSRGGKPKSPAPAMAVLPLRHVEVEIIRTAVFDTEVNLAPLSIVSNTAGPGVIGGAGGSGNGTGTGAGNGGMGGRLFAPCETSPDRPIVADVYQVLPGYDLRRTTLRDAVSTICMAQLDITPRNFKEGFPGLNMIEWFSLDIRFTVNVPEQAVMDLLLVNDDGAILYIDGAEVINNDGLHASLKASAQRLLTKGPHDFRVRYYQGPGEALALVLAWKKQGDKDYGYIAKRLLSRPRSAKL